MAISISAVIITYNEERNIERCLSSLKGVVDEIVVVDSFSKDRTEEICKLFNVRFIQNPFEGHIQQKNYAIDCASNDWIISLDADEALTDTLKKSILTIKEDPAYLGYRMNRLTNYCGHWVNYCGWYPDTKIRLVNRNNARWQGVNPHDRLDMNNGEETGFLEGDLLHYSYYTREDHLKQIEYFGDIAARELYQRGGRSNYFKIVIKVVAQFFKSYFLKLGILDGSTGFTISRLSAYATYRKYVKLLNLQRGK
ncbi:MAG: glycosyltransferase family 2 protein [Flavobacteriales bacterium]|jgi:glycosyltransferase involved in cell wall biosynthesis